MGLELALAGASIVGGIYSSRQQSKAANIAADAQTAAAQQGIEEQRRQFDAIQALLKPYVDAGSGALGAQKDLIGLNGNETQAAAIQALQNSPQFTSALKLGEDRILANASATGGLRGGNTQAAFAQFSPALLASTINDQYARLGGLTSLGQNSAAMTGNAGMATGNNVTQLLQQIGSAQAGNALAQGKARVGMVNSITGALGNFAGLGGFGGGGGFSLGNLINGTGLGGGL